MVQATCIEKCWENTSEEDVDIYYPTYKLRLSTGEIEEHEYKKLFQLIKNREYDVANLKIVEHTYNGTDEILVETAAQVEVTEESLKEKADVASLINKARIFGNITEIKTECGHTCYLINASTNKHVLYIPDDVGALNKWTSPHSCTHLPNRRVALELKALHGEIKVIGGRGLVNASLMFYDCEFDTIDLSRFHTDNVKDMFGMFASCRNLRSLNISGMNTGNVEIMSYMFDNCGLEELDFSVIDTSKCKFMQRMFSNSKFEELELSSFDTSNAINMRRMFSKCEAHRINISRFNTNKVIDMGGLFEDCENIKEIDVSSLDTRNVESMAYMFSGLTLDSLDISTLDTSNVRSMLSMFNELTVPNLDLRTLNTSKVKDMRCMFSRISTNSLDFSRFDTSNVENMSHMFRYMNIRELDLSSFDTHNVKYMHYMFADSKILNIDISSFDTSNVVDASSMFSGLVTVKLDLRNFNTKNIKDMEFMFQRSTIAEINLSSFELCEWCETRTTRMFDKCSTNKVMIPDKFFNVMTRDSDMHECGVCVVEDDNY